jgi:leucyl-tRNA synthetase
VMSKSKGNTIAPDDVIKEYGADTLRLYILSVAPPEMALEWSDETIAGSHRLILRVWRFVDRHAEAVRGAGRETPAELPAAVREARRRVHQTTQRVTQDVDRLHLNTAVSAFHELVNELYRLEGDLASEAGRPVLREAVETLLTLLNPFVPHVTEELWARLGNREALLDRSWPVADAAVAREDTIEMAVQVNGKVRGRIEVAPDEADEPVQTLALQAVAAHVEGKTIQKVVVVPRRLVNVVVR